MAVCIHVRQERRFNPRYEVWTAVIECLDCGQWRLVNLKPAIGPWKNRIMAKEGSRDVGPDPKGQKPATEEAAMPPPEQPAEEEPDREITPPVDSTSRKETVATSVQTPPVGSSDVVGKKTKCGGCGRKTYELVRGRFDSLICRDCAKAFPALVEAG